MANLSPTKVPVPEQDPNVRNHNFEEVNLGYTPEMAVEEAMCIRDRIMNYAGFKEFFNWLIVFTHSLEQLSAILIKVPQHCY